MIGKNSPKEIYEKILFSGATEIWKVCDFFTTLTQRGKLPLESTHKDHLTPSFFENEWQFSENPKIDGDTHPFLKSGKITNHHDARARICFLLKWFWAIQLRRNSIFVAETFFRFEKNLFHMHISSSPPQFNPELGDSFDLHLDEKLKL